MLHFTIALIIGILLGNELAEHWHYCPSDASIWIIWGIMSIWTISMFIIFYYQSQVKSLIYRIQSRLFGIATFMFFLCLGLFVTIYSYRQINEVNLGIDGKKYITGTVITSLQSHSKTWSTTLRTENNGRILCYLAKKDSINCNIGDSIILYAPYGAEAILNNYSDTTQYHEYHRYLLYHGINATCYAYDYFIQQTTCTDYSPQAIQTTLHKWYQDSGINGKEGAVIEAMTTGNKSTLSKELKSQYAQAGASHVLALSGFHLTIIFSLIQYLFMGRWLPDGWRYNKRGLRWITDTITILTLWTYVYISAAPLSLIRAAIMCTIMLICKYFQQNVLSLNSLVIAAFSILLASPLSIYDVGFQLSFLSMLGICLFGNRLKILTSFSKKDSRLIRLLKKIINSMIGVIWISLICTVFTMPFTSYYFGQISLVGIPCNICISLIATSIMWMSATWWAAWLIGISPSTCGLTHALLALGGWLNGVTEFFSSLPYAVLDIQLNSLGVSCWMLIVFLLFYMWDFVEGRGRVTFSQFSFLFG